MVKNISAKEKIIAAFMELLYERGNFEKIETKEITKKAQLSPSTFFYCFKSKDILFKELYNRAWEKINDKINDELLYGRQLQKKDHCSEYRNNIYNTDLFMGYKNNDKSLPYFIKSITIFNTILDFIIKDNKLSTVLFLKEANNINNSRAFLIFIKLIDALIQEGQEDNILYSGFSRQYLRMILIDIGRRFLKKFYIGIYGCNEVDKNYNEEDNYLEYLFPEYSKAKGRRPVYLFRRDVEDVFVKYLLTFYCIEKRLYLINIFAMNKLFKFITSYIVNTKIKSFKEKQFYRKLINEYFTNHYSYMKSIYDGQRNNILSQLQWYSNVAGIYPKLLNKDKIKMFKKDFK